MFVSTPKALFLNHFSCGPRRYFPFSHLIWESNVSQKRSGNPPKMDSNLTFQMGFFIHVLFSTCNSGHHAPTICQPTRTPVKGSFFPTGPIDITIEATSTKKPRGQESLASYFGDEILVTKKGIRLRKNPSKFASTRWISLFERHDFGTFQAFWNWYSSADLCNSWCALSFWGRWKFQSERMLPASNQKNSLGGKI